MAVCELLEGCIFFNGRMRDMPVSAERMKANYCRGDHTKCARFVVYQKLGRPAVPTDLYPNYMEKARRIIAGR